MSDRPYRTATITLVFRVRVVDEDDAGRVVDEWRDMMNHSADFVFLSGTVEPLWEDDADD